MLFYCASRKSVTDEANDCVPVDFRFSQELSPVCFVLLFVVFFFNFVSSFPAKAENKSTKIPPPPHPSYT